MIAIIDYGMGNLRSVQKALEAVGAKAKVTSRPEDLKRCVKLVFPGVGAFGEAMKELKKRGLVNPIKTAIESGKYFLGLCLGLQLLFDDSEEAPGIKGLAILKGRVRKFKFTSWKGRSFERSSSSFGRLRTNPERSQMDSSRSQDQIFFENLKVPHIGWNNIVESRESRVESSNVLDGVPNGSYMYFVHSYYVVPEDKDIVIATTDYGIKFASGIHKDNIYGFQFHPEKSQEMGLKILKNFVRL